MTKNRLLSLPLGRRRRKSGMVVETTPSGPRVEDAPAIDIQPNDPIVAYFEAASGAVDIEALDLESPARDALIEAGMKLVVPLISQGELIGLLNLGPRLSEQAYSGDDRKLLENLASQAAPAVKVAQLVRQQEAEARQRERMEQELRVAQLIQQQFLPKVLPELKGWQVSAFYRPAREVGGDFYDFIELDDGKVGLVIGDVTDKGVPAALVMATTRAILRGAASRMMSPGEVLKRVNELLVPDIPPQMFVTCLYGILDPETGHFDFANAGHNLPYVNKSEGVVELRATGMPLGLMPDMSYEEKEADLGYGEVVLLYSDGIDEAHDPDGDMFGFPRLMGAVKAAAQSDNVIDSLIGELERFTGPGWDQEDDITLVTIRRTSGAESAFSEQKADMSELGAEVTGGEVLVDEFSVPSEEGNERVAIDRLTGALADLGIEAPRLERLKTALGEAVMNAIEHGNAGNPDAPVGVRVASTPTALRVSVTDRGGGAAIPEAETPDIEAKLAGEQTPRGWGLFLIKNMVDDLSIASDGDHHTVTLTVYLKGAADEHESV